MTPIQQRIHQSIERQFRAHARELGAEGKQLNELGDDQLAQIGMHVQTALAAEIQAGTLSPLQILEGLMNARINALEETRKAAQSPNLAKGDVQAGADQHDIASSVTSAQLKTAWAPSSGEIKAAAAVFADVIRGSKSTSVELGFEHNDQTRMHGHSRNIDPRMMTLIRRNDQRMVQALNDELAGAGITVTKAHQFYGKTVSHGTEIDPFYVDVTRTSY